jgi:mannose-6-phosphate isomerase-like protein (cupin superfamily)
MSEANNPLGERRPINIESRPWDDYSDPLEPGRAPGPLVRWLVDPASGNRVMHVKSWPGRTATPHWHLSDTVYIVTKGEFIVEGEDEPYREGDLRWVRGGFAYGPERCGPDGVEYLFISLGPYDKLEPDEFPPPRGRWDDPSTWKEGYPQVARRALLAEDPRRAKEHT